MAANFDAWWAFNMLPEHDGRADDNAPGETFDTRWGFTYQTWTTARRWVGFRDVSKATFNRETRETMGMLADRFFWTRQGGDTMPAGSDLTTIDWTWTSGGAAMEIQRYLGFRGTDIDGVIGKKTVAAIANMGISYIADVYGLRCDYYDALGFREKFPGLYLRAKRCMDISEEIAVKASAGRKTLPGPRPVA